MDWFRSHHGAPTDPKWIVVAKRSETQPGVVAAIWWALMDYASQQEDRGSVAGFDCEMIATFFGWDEAMVVRVVDALRDRKLISADRITNWGKRQPAREDHSTGRVRQFRERQKESGNDVKRNETHGNGRGEGDGEERRTEEITTPPPPPADASAGSTVVEFLDSLPTTARREWWEREIAGWRDGLNLQRPATEADIDAGLRDYLARSDRDYSPKHIRGFVASATRARLQNVIPIGTGPPGRPRPTQPTIAQRAFAVTREAIEDL